jgi:hypothetical protein
MNMGLLRRFFRARSTAPKPMSGKVLAIAGAIVGGAESVDQQARRRRAADGGEDRVRAGDGFHIVSDAVAAHELDAELIELRRV